MMAERSRSHLYKLFETTILWDGKIRIIDNDSKIILNDLIKW